MHLNRRHNLLDAGFANLSAYDAVDHGIYLGRSDSHRDADRRLDVGAAADDASANRRRIGRAMNMPLVFLRQMHGRGVAVIDSPAAVESACSIPPEADAAITRLPNVGLAIQTADCQAVMLYDPVRHAVANIHSGWRGSVADIIGECAATMTRRFGTDPSDVIAGIGPSLGPCCAEFVNYRTELPETFWEFKDEADRFNFWRISRRQLTAAGVRPSNIEESCICTRCNPHLLFSHRHNPDTGRFAAVIGLRQRRGTPAAAEMPKH